MLAIAVLLAGCAPKQIAELRIRLGEEVDKPTGYFAYKSSLTPQQTSNVVLSLASEAKISARQLLIRADTTAVYPRVGYTRKRCYIRPSVLAAILGVAPEAPRTTPADTIVLGYFMKRLSDTYEANPALVPYGLAEPGPTRGLLWALSPKISEKQAIRQAVDNMQAVAAREGGERIVDLCVFWTSEPSPYGQEGQYVSAKLIALGRVQDP
jgi:hypothetical protein